MSLLSDLRERLRALLFRAREDRDLDEELAFHLEMQTEANIARGMSPEEARRQALIQLGGLAQVREATRDARGIRWLDDLAADVRFALRTLRNHPAFTLAAAATLALGIGGTTVVFGVVDALFLRPPAGVRAPDEVARVLIVRDEGAIRTPAGGPGSYLDFAAMRSDARGFSDVAAMIFPMPLDLDRGENAEQVTGQVVSWNFLSLLGVRPAVGRFFTAEEDSVPGAHPVVVLSHGFWQRRFGGDRGIVGRTLLLNGQAATVIGVAEAGFTGIDPLPIDVWVPTAIVGPLFGLDQWRALPTLALVTFIARLAPGVEATAAAAEAASALRHAAETYPMMDPTPDVRLASLVHAQSGTLASSRTTRVAPLLMGVTALVLVIACANVANLLLARGTARRRETAVRASLGATRGRLVRQHLTESVVLAALGGLAGIALAAAGSRLTRMFPIPPGAADLSLRVLGFACVVTLLSGLAFGIAPALRSALVAPADGLKGGDVGVRPGRGRTRRALVALQVALSLVLLSGAGLLIRSLREVNAIDPGLDTDRLLVVTVGLAKAGYDRPAREVFYAEARERVPRIPGVEGAAMAHLIPLGGGAQAIAYDHTVADTMLVEVGPYVNWVDDGFFAVTGTRVLRGREFTPQDIAGAEPVAILDERMARVLAPGGDPFERCIPLGDQVQAGGCTRIVGIVETVRHRYLEEPTVPHVYLPRRRDARVPSFFVPALLVRTHGEPAAYVHEVRAAVQSIAPNLPYVAVRPYEELLRAEKLPFRIGATLFTLFGALALAIAAVGLYGVLGYFVAERTNEIGIRRSLGATDGRVIGLVVRQGMSSVAIGAALGIAGALAGGRLIQSILFGVSARDPLTLVGVTAVLVVVAIVASLVPAIRVARVDPMVALRVE